MVIMSAEDVTIGVDTVSRSYPRRPDTTDKKIVRDMITPEPRTPPTTEIVTKSRNEIEGRRNNAAAKRARSTSYSDDENVVTTPV